MWAMTDDRVNIKVPPGVHTELNDAREMSWPDQLIHWKRMAEGGGSGTRDGSQAVLDRLDDLEARLPRKVAEELGR